MAMNQAYLFLVFTINGILIGLLFDFFRILRKNFKTTNIITYIEDILFWILTGVSVIFSMYKFSDGTLRVFMFLGLCFGIVMYILTLSKFIIKICTFVIIYIKKIIKKILKIIVIPLKFIYDLIDKLIFRPIYLFYIRKGSILTKYFKKGDKNMNKTKKFKLFEGFIK